jgi:AraC-like DNA-binding protein
MLTTRSEYQSAGMTVMDVHCDGCDSGRYDVEHNRSFEIVVTRRGAFSRSIGRRSALASSGSVSFWNAGEEYSISHPARCGDVNSVFSLGADGAREFLHNFGVRRDEPVLPTLTLAQLDAKLYLQHRYVLQAIRAGADPFRVDELLMMFLSALCRAPFAVRPDVRASALFSSRVRRELVDAVRAVLTERRAERVSLASVAKEVGVSLFHLSHVYSSATSEPIHRHLVRIRLRSALDPLIDTDDSISRIAAEAGFSSHAHFSHAFRREFGVTPAEARKRRIQIARLR